MPETPWTDAEQQRLAELRAAGMSIENIAIQLGRSHSSVDSKLKRQRLAQRRTQAHRVQKIAEAASVSPIEVDHAARIRELEAEVARLREQRKWETHSGSEQAQGGTLTLRRSDDHHCDDNHMLSCAASLTEKFLVVLQQYQPSVIQLIQGDDWIAGRGIFKEQDAQMAVAAIEQQISVGAVKKRRFLQAIRSVSNAPITIHWLRGNHEYANKIQVHHALFYETRALCEDIPDVKYIMWGDVAFPVNLAHRGFHNVIAQHGYGHSQVSPNSPRFISDTKDRLIGIQRRFPAEQHPRRVLSGHTHWLDCGTERLVGLEFDTTGGLQRNNRVQLGMNSRPSGWIVYVGPPDAEGEILRPIPLKPEEETYQRELGDPHLAAANKQDAGECLREHRQIMQERGVLGPGDEFGIVTEGRW